MTKPDVEIIRHHPGRTTVLVNGKPLAGVRTVEYRETAREAPLVTVALVANRVMVREEPRPLSIDDTPGDRAVPAECDCPGPKAGYHGFHLDTCPRREARPFA